MKISFLILISFFVNPNLVMYKAISANSAEALRQFQPKVTSRKLRYLYFANGGLLGYFSDGTVAGCPRCDLLKSNIEALYKQKPFKKYSVQKGYLLVNRNEKNVLKSKTIEEGWAMINYKWLIKIEGEN